MSENGTGATTVKSDETLLSILFALKELDGGGITELAAHLGLAKSTVHNHLTTMLAHGFVVKEGDTYYLGLRFLDLGESARQRNQAHELIAEKVDELAATTDERAQFIVEEHGRGIYLYRAIGRHAVRTDSRIGKRVPLTAISAGKAILSRLPEERIVDIVETVGLPQRTEQTITDADELFADLERTRDRGYAINDEESTNGLRAIGVPVMSADGSVLGALSVSGPTHRLTGEWFESEIPTTLLGAANEIELTITFS